jgi:hypothetical protein
MLKLCFCNENLISINDPVEALLNQKRSKKCNYVVDFDCCGRVVRVYGDSVYTVNTRENACNCPYRKYHDTCKHIEAARLLESRVEVLECPQCEGTGWFDDDDDDDDGECSLCSGEGCVFRLKSPQEGLSPTD